MGRAGETALVVVCAVLLAVSLAALAGFGLACLVAGGGWVWPHGSNLDMRVLGGLASGHPGRGLPPQLAARVPAAAAVYTGVAVAELGLLALTGAGWMVFARYYRPGDARAGMATRSEAQQVLGTARLWAGWSLIRPDLHQPVHRPHSRGEPAGGLVEPDGGALRTVES